MVFIVYIGYSGLATYIYVRGVGIILVLFIILQSPIHYLRFILGLRFF